MKKNFLLTLLLALCTSLQCWAEFNPTPGKMYALKEVTSGLYLDIQTLGIVDGTRNTNNISLNANPRIIYFENGSTTGTWKLKNINGKYVYHVTPNNDGHWNPEIKDTPSDWTITESAGKITIARSDKKYINVDTKEAGQPLYCDKGTGMEFSLVELYAALKSPTGTYLNFTPVSNGSDNTTQVSFCQQPSYLYIHSTSEGITFEDKSNSGRYIGISSSKNWNVDFGIAYWTISTPDTNGYVTISQRSDSSKNLGHDKNTNDGTGIFANVGSGVNKWIIELHEVVADKYANTIPAFDAKDITVIQNNGQYLQALTLDGQTVFTGKSSPTSKGDMYVLVDNANLSVQPGATHTFTLTFPKNQTSQVLTVVLWMDKDGDGTFESHLGTKGQQNSNSNDLSTVTFTVPSDATLGKTRIRFRLDSSWGITTAPDAAANRMVYDIPVTVEDSKPTASVTYNFIYEGKKIGSETNAKAVIGNPYPAPQTQFKVATELLSFELPEGEVTEAGGTFNVTVSFKKNGFPATTAISNGLFASDTQWYLTTLRGKYLRYNGTNALYSYAGKEYSEAAFFTVTGNPIEGYKLYNKAIGTGKVIYSNTPNNLSSEVALEANPNGTWYVADNSKGGFSFYIPYNGSKFYFHEKDGPIKYWSDDNSKTDAGSNFIFEPVYDYTLDISYAPSAVEVTYNGKTINVGDEISRIGFDKTLINATDVSGFYWDTYVDDAKNKVYVVYKKYYTFDISNAPTNVTVTHNGETLANGATIKIEDFYAGDVVATDVNGYIWQVDVDQANYTVTLLYKSAMQPVIDLVNRIGGVGTADYFKFVLDPTLHQTQETFVIGTEDGKILIKGTTISAITTGIGWYLNHIAKVNIAWNSLNEKTVDFGKSGAAYVENINLPLPTTTETHTSDAKYRYYLNTCTFGYSMTSWTWTRWQQEIDWMALHGINMPLQLVGMEEVWRKFLTLEDVNGNRKYGYTDEAAKAFVAGPAFIAWWAMNNLEGWGGTAPGTKSGGTWEGAGGVQDDAWYVRQKNLSNSIVTRQRELGMQPVLPGWSGMVPTNFAAKSGYATRGNGGNWAGDFVRPLLLNVSNANYAEIAADYYACLKDVMGESQYYSMDPFHEGGGAGTMEDYKALYAAMEAAKSGSQWVIQQWQWSATQKYSLTAVPAGKLIVLDLFSDGSPAFDGYNGYDPQDAVFCAIPNFGGRSGLMGRLHNVTDNYFSFKEKYKSIKGIGTAPEAIEQTPVTYDLIYQLPWMNGEKPNVEEWVNNYSIARYGKDNAVVKEAWSLLRQGPLNYGADGIQGPVEDVWAARPNLDANKASSWGKTLADAGGTYTPARRQMLIDAVYKLIDQEDELELADGSVYKSNYLYDLVEFGGGVMADYAYDLLLGIKAAKNASNTALYEARRDAFLQLILDMDAFRGTNLNFRLGKWTQEARDAATEVTGATTATPDWYEYNNARTILTTWSSPGTNLTDYSYRSWQGLLKDYYYKRWKYYFDNNCNGGQYEYFEWNWAHGMTHAVGQNAVSTTPLTADQEGHTSKYTREPEGNTVTEAWNLLNKYIVALKGTNGTTKYAYRHLGLEHNDYASAVTIAVPAGTVDLTPYLTGNLTNVTLTSGAVTGNATDLSAVNVTGSAGTYDATLTFDDKTVIKFKLQVNDAKKVALEDLINRTNELIAECGTITPNEPSAITLTESQLSDNWGKQEGSLSNLLDGNSETYYVSNWSSTPNTAHYIQIDLGAGNELEQAIITFSARKGGGAPTPTKITISCSTDGTTFNDVQTFTQAADGLPAAANGEKWTSPVLTVNQAARYWRFTVLECTRAGDNKGTNSQGIYHFGIGDLGILKSNGYTVTVTAESPKVTEELLLNTDLEVQKATRVLNSNATDAEVTQATTSLQAQYDELYNALYDKTAIAAKEAKAFLDATPASAGYPNAAEREKFLAVIEAQESVEAIEEAQADFVAATNVYMPENGKAYVIRNVHPNDATYMLTGGYEGTNPKLPTAGDNVTNANIFICRVVTGGYVFVNAEHGKYMLFHGKSGNYPLSEDGFSLTYSTDNILKINSQTGKRFGTLSIAGLRTEWQTGNKAYGTMTIKKDGSMDANGGENNPSYTDTYSSLFTFEEVAVKDYAINKPTHTPVIKEQNPLLSGIGDNQTISTFSAPYATVMPKGITAYYAQKAYDGNTLYLTAMEEGKALPAGQGVILIGSKDVNAAAIVPATEEERAEINESNNFFKSSAAGDVTMGDNDYILAKGEQGIGIYKAQSKTKLKAGKAYLSFENAQQAKSFVMQFGGTPTGIENTLLGTPNAHDAIYDLSGRRVNTITKGGLYIVNGKKVFIK